MSWIASFNDITPGELFFRTFPPCPQLQHLVAYYWVLKCDANAPYKDELLMPDGFEEIIFSYSGGYRRQVRRNGCETKKVSGSYIIAGKDQAVTCTRFNTLNMVGVKLLPQSLHHIGRVPVNELFNQVRPLNDLRSSTLLELEGKLYEAQNIEKLQNELNNTLSQLLLNIKYDPLVNAAIKTIYLNKGRTDIATIKEKYGCHYRTLEKKFKLTLGMSPKKFSRNIRFKHAFSSLEESNRQTHFLLEDHGFYDQSHLSREFCFYTGLTPSQYFQTRNNFSTNVFETSHAIEAKESGVYKSIV